MTNDDVIVMLNSLIQSSKEGEQAFRILFDVSRQCDTQCMLLDYAKNYAAAAIELQGLVSRLGGAPVRHSSVNGMLRCKWTYLKSFVMGRNDHLLLSRCECGGDATLKCYRRVLQKSLPAHIRIVLELQYQCVLSNHDRFNNLCDWTRFKNVL